MLINCPECGREISDKAKQCIHCGYPLDEKRIEDEKFSNDKNSRYDISLKSEGEGYYHFLVLGVIRKIWECGLTDAVNMRDKSVYLKQEILFEEAEYIKQEIEKVGGQVKIFRHGTEDIVYESIKSKDPKCPVCGSTFIAPGGRGYGNRCLKCGYSWHPKLNK